MAKSSIDIDGYTIIRRLGVGARTTIYLAKNEETRATVALIRGYLNRWKPNTRSPGKWITLISAVVNR